MKYSLKLIAWMGLSLSATVLSAAPETKPAPDTPEAAEQRRQIAEKYRRQYARNSDKLAVTDLKPLTANAAVFQRFELQFQVDGRFENPFDPDQIRVDATVTRPDGSTATVPAFFMQQYESADGETRLESNVKYRPPGETSWRLRFTPTQPGEYKIVLTAVQADGQRVSSEPVSFTASAAEHPGWVTVSKRNPQYFETSADGKLFYPVGVNIPWTRTAQGKSKPELGRPDGTFEYYFGKAKGNMTATRVWQCHYGWLEWMPQPEAPPTNSWGAYGGVTHYNQAVARAFDRVFELGEESNLRIMLVLDDNDEHQRTPATGWPWHAWAANPYNRINGGPCEKADEIFTDPAARAGYKKRLRYIMARWGYSPSLWAINVWNDRTSPPPFVLPWLKEMHAYTHELADQWRPIIFGTNFGFEAQKISDYAQAEESRVYPGKPSVKQEAYYTHDAEYFNDTVRFELWKHLTRGYGGVMVWPHARVDNHGGWHTFAGPMNFVKDLPLNAYPFKPADVKVVSAVIDGESQQPASRIMAMQTYGDVPHWAARATENRFEVDLSGGSQFMPGLCGRFYGDRKQQWRNDPTFVFTLPADGHFILDVNELSGDEMKLVATNKGQPLFEFPLEGSARRPPTKEQKFIRIPLKAGEYELNISLQGPGSDWLWIRRMLLSYAEPDAAKLLTAYGMASDRHAMLYLRNGTCGELPEKFLQRKPVKLRDVEVEIASLGTGKYDVVLYDVNENREISRQTMSADDGKLRVRIPQIDQHVAVKVVPAP